MCFSCGDKLVKVVDNRLLQRGVCFDRGHQDGQVTVELVGHVRDGGVVFREFEMVRDKIAEFVKRHEGGLDIVYPRMLSGHSVEGR